MRCNQCGAAFPDLESCSDRFNTCQGTELEQPDYYTVHHLSVPCYMLQHNAYTQQGWLAAYDLLHRFVHEGFSPSQARAEARISADSGQRSWSFTRGAKLPGVELITWSLTIADIRLDSAGHYGTDVRAWAAGILVDSSELVSASRRET